jgi:glyoxylase-like metal-dependent hydrolase (beta-lactamase superfamily II)
MSATAGARRPPGPIRLQLTRIAEGVHRLSSVQTNWYVLEEGGRLTVLDAGFPRDWPAFCAALGRLGHAPADVDAVLITHHHVDHAGNAERLRAEGARVMAHAAEIPYITGAESRPSSLRVLPHLRHPWYARYIARNVVKGVLRTPAVARLDELADGEVVDVPGSPKVIHAPGHTAGSCALLVEDESLLFTGDALVTIDLDNGAPGPRVVRGPHTDDAERALESLTELAATRAGTVLPGHGEPWNEGVEAAVRIARAAGG